jgi:ComF family protein
VCEEAVFSGSEDRIRASAASAGVAGVGLAERPIVLKKPVSPGPLRLSRAHKPHGMGSISASRSSVGFPFPSHCRLRREPLRNIPRLAVCTDCREETFALQGKGCSIRGERVLSSYAEADEDGRARCPVCHRVRRPFSCAFHHGSYDDGRRELVHLLKGNGVRPAAAVLGRVLAEAISALEPAFTQSPVLVVPVPLYEGRRHQRGFNQAELIARDALKTLPGSQLQLRTDILSRTRDAQPQIGLTSHQRREHLRGAFAVARAEEVTGREVLLVDDVYTTGTTVTECARVLRHSGAVQVWVAAVASTLKLASNYAGIAPRDVEESTLARAVGAEYRFPVFKLLSFAATSA